MEGFTNDSSEHLFADIIVDISHEKLDRTFQYLIPQELCGQLRVGCVVQIPFGKGDHLRKGYVVNLTDRSAYPVERMKSIRAILTDVSQLSGEDRLVALAAWMKEACGSTMIQALKTVLPIRKTVKPKEKKTIVLTAPTDIARGNLSEFMRKHQKARVRLLEALIEEREIPYELVVGKLNISPATIRSLQEMGLLACESQTVYRNPLAGQEKQAYQIKLHEEQQLVTDTIWNSWQQEKSSVSLLHGITGSGKTEIYIELIARTIAQGKQAIMLIPEISLTYQTVMRFYRRFGDRISIIHSRLSAGERYDQFCRAKNGDIDVMIGPRSALFTPFDRLGVIIIDEEHEPSYKSESVPRYHARETAVCRAQLESAHVVLGSATPSLESYYRAKTGVYHLYELHTRAKESRLPSVEIADMREELKNGNRTILSRQLQEQIAVKLAAGEQIMLFLNRRGYAGFLSCRSCGHVIMCPHCDVSLSVHNNGKLICHYCGYQTPRPEQCPECGSEFLSGFGIGTQQVEAAVKKMYPQARVLRMDMDTTREKDGHEKILTAFANQEADILVGTQMIVKGHDFPQVTLVGILAADLSLYAEDFRAAERTFQLITQAAGRAGRGDLPGNVVIQTYDPEHYCILTAADQDYLSFYEEEIAYRMIGSYPPVNRILSVHGAAKDEAHLTLAMDYLKKFAQRITAQNSVKVFGPAPERIAKIQDVFRMVLYLKGETREEMIAVKNKLEQYIEINEGYRPINIQFDMND